MKTTASPLGHVIFEIDDGKGHAIRLALWPRDAWVLAGRLMETCEQIEIEKRRRGEIHKFFEVELPLVGPKGGPQ